MDWWHTAFASKSDSAAAAAAAGFSSKAGFFATLRSRHLSRAAKIRQVPDNDVRSSPARSSSALPQPLPLPRPKERVLLLRDTTESGNMPLPAPVHTQLHGEAIHGVNELKRLPGDQDIQTKAEHSKTWPRRKSPPKHNNYSDGCTINNIASAPTSPYTSNATSLQRGDMSMTQYMTLQSLVANAQANVHPLPLPPGTALSSSTPQCPPAPSHVVKPEFPLANIPSQRSSVSSSGGSKTEFKSQWQKGKLIGKGTFGSVYVASNRETGALCAMKEVQILPGDSKSAECLRQLEQEIKVLSHLKHPNIVQYYGSEIIGDKFNIYLEYVHPGSINKFIHDHCSAITESVVRNFTRHILCGLAYLHGTKTIHRDIKGANLLVDAYGVVKLADFGMAKHLHGQTANLSLKGSPYWIAPELLQSSLQTEASPDAAFAVDIWSLGCTIIEMMNGKPPWSEYEGAAALFKALKETPPMPETMSEEGRDFLQCCFRRNPADRPTASQLLEHPFVSQSHQPDSSSNRIKR